ncbi:MAG: hypothetical protein ACT4NL_04465 [Pseudomarimonas sp.]
MGKKSMANTETLTKADALAYLKQFPFHGPLFFGLGLLPVLASNGYLLWLMLQGRLTGPGLILIVVIETVMVTVLARLSALPIPRADWIDQPKPWSQVLPVLVFLLIWCSGAYGLTLLFIGGWREMLSYFQGTQIWLDSGVAYALALTLVLAIFPMVSDWQRYRRIGPPFMASLGHDAMARLLTLIFGGIPFAMPFFVVVIGGFKLLEWIVLRAKRAPRSSALAAVCMLAVAGCGFLLVEKLIQTEAHAWAIGYMLAKLVSELMVASIPLVMHVASNELPAEAPPPVKKKRPRS